MGAADRVEHGGRVLVRDLFPEEVAGVENDAAATGHPVGDRELQLGEQLGEHRQFQADRRL
jgi:hypothetical protein